MFHSHCIWPDRQRRRRLFPCSWQCWSEMLTLYPVNKFVVTRVIILALKISYKAVNYFWCQRSTFSGFLKAVVLFKVALCPSSLINLCHLLLFPIHPPPHSYRTATNSHKFTQSRPRLRPLQRLIHARHPHLLRHVITTWVAQFSSSSRFLPGFPGITRIVWIPFSETGSQSRAGKEETIILVCYC